MKKNFIVFMFISLLVFSPSYSNSQNASAPTQATSEVEEFTTLEEIEAADAQQTQAILTHFANIVNSFFGIVQDPHNPVNVGSNVANMLGSIVNIAVEAMTKHLPKNASEQEIIDYVRSFEEELKLMLHELITAKALQLRERIAVSEEKVN